VIAWSAVILMGIVLGMLGGGGAILTVPILVHLFDVPVLQATHQSMLIVGLASAVGAISHLRRGEVDLRTALVFALPSLVGVALARRFVLPMVPDSLLGLNKGSWVLLAFAMVMLFAGSAMLRSSGAGKSGVSVSPVSAGARGLGVGMVTGLVGAGGGFLIVPALNQLLRLPMRVAVGTSMVIVVLNSTIGFITPFIGNVQQILDAPWSFLLGISAVGMTGIVVGTRLGQHVKPESLKRAFGFFVIAMAIVIVALEVRGF
jgi:uncharacterized membrane protein YfcA